MVPVSKRAKRTQFRTEETYSHVCNRCFACCKKSQTEHHDPPFVLECVTINKIIPTNAPAVDLFHKVIKADGKGNPQKFSQNELHTQRQFYDYSTHFTIKP